MRDVGGTQVNTIATSRDWMPTLKYAQRITSPKLEKNNVPKNVVLYIEGQVYQNTLIESLAFFWDCGCLSLTFVSSFWVLQNLLGPVRTLSGLSPRQSKREVQDVEH